MRSVLVVMNNYVGRNTVVGVYNDFDEALEDLDITMEQLIKPPYSWGFYDLQDAALA